MISLSALDSRPGGKTVVITDSGLGGLLICAGLESRLRGLAGGPVRLVYVNAWPDAGYGYNDLPDIPARAAVFDRALAAMAQLEPSLILIACNTLSVVYEETAFHRAPAVPVAGILEEGVDLFGKALSLEPEAVLALFGTRTTIGSGEHARRLAERGIEPRRVFAEPCHGLAAAIDHNPDAPAVPGLIEECVLRAARRLPLRVPLFAGLACTHYAYVAEGFRESLRRLSGASVEVLDPGARLVDGLVRGLAARTAADREAQIKVEVICKIELPEAQRKAVARRIDPLSPATARALLAYRRSPQLF
ncbi:MAG: aspartate/glutamate racemase family protein [Candidatus Aminicenantes bacterium]|nr:aspartate/glutamate racemase family protein [Candidatus Aminicenantes bacterium]